MDFRKRNRADRAVLARMTDRLVHRGPDSDGYFLEDEVGLGFRRLAIIDLVTGDQPMFNGDRSLALMCNGEIYNYRELREDLIHKGFVFRTNSDVETLLYLYELHGVDFLRLLNGQFAFVIYDRNRKRLFLARDHFGVNPLFYTIVDGVLIFASEIKAILAHPLARREVDLTGLDQLLSFPGLISPRTMFKGVSSLKSGHMMIAEDEHLQIREYWDLDYPQIGECGPERPENEYVERLRELLQRAVSSRLHADVPVGYYLSGGLDSAMIAAIGQKASPETIRSTFSVRFSDPEICESEHQRIMAESLGARHHEICFDWSEIAGSLTKMVYHCETPVKESFNTCAMALSRSARAQDIPVVLAGQGADEIFAGYMGYRFDRHNTRSDQGYDLETVMEDELRETLWGDADIFYEKDQYAYRAVKTALYSPILKQAFDRFDCLNFELVNKDKLKGRDRLHQRSYLDFKLRLSDHLLSEHGDRMALMNSVEGRYPFLDINVVEYAREIPPRLKLNQYTEKYILKKIAEGLVPRSIIEREKFGFRAPSSPYLLRRNIDWINDLLAYERIKRQGYFDPDLVERLKTRYLSDGFKLNAHLETDLLMVVLTFGIFLDEFQLPDLA